MSDFKLPVIIMAGSDKDRSDKILDYAGVDYKALIKLNGKTIIEYMLAGLVESGRISRYYIVGLPKDKVNLPTEIDPNHVKFLELEGGKVPERLAATAKMIVDDAKSDPNIFPKGKYHGLFIPGDVPFLRGDIINSFLDKVGDLSCDLYATIVKEEVMISRFPSSNRTYGKLVEGKFCVGDVSCFDFTMVEERLEMIRTLRENRKTFVKVIFKLRPMIIIKYLIKRVKIKDMNNAVGKVFKLKSKLIVMEYAEIAMDVDKPEQLELARKELSHSK